MLGLLMLVRAWSCPVLLPQRTKHRLQGPASATARREPAEGMPLVGVERLEGCEVAGQPALPWPRPSGFLLGFAAHGEAAPPCHGKNHVVICSCLIMKLHVSLS